ncbi:ATP-binding protein [Turicibacter sanguinis]|uniref:ATP-binding protein n=1 Tax=Turicibacter sanguinis TaxID=154288 RepID=UPI0018AA5170|nr:ATP-binding protein [Turicibacter sanguinis]MDB8550983.1 ATP-binding protein [Turicibacter sanguinis]
MNEKELVPYAPNLVESTRSIGYSFETALADIIDNSISNFATRVDVEFRGGDNPCVAIIDNGSGMTSTTLEQAMRYGSSSILDKRSEEDLGRFGLGLKMASMSQCRKLTVITKYKGVISAACWDLDHIHKTGKWSLIVYPESTALELKFARSLDELKSGTVVLWEKLDRISESRLDFEREFNEKLDYADRHISLVFHRFMDKNETKKTIDFYFNKRKLEPIDPFMTKHKATQPLEEESVFIDRVQMKVKSYIIPYANKLSAEERQVLNKNKDLNLNQGIYIYRNKRLIVWGKWFRIVSESELSRLARVRIDLPNSIDHLWKIDVKKSNAAIPSMIKEQLKMIILRTIGKSERVYRYRGRKIKTDSYEHVWNKIKNRDKFQYVVNRDLPLYKALEDSLSDEQLRLLDCFLNSIEDAFPYDAVYYDKATDVQFEEKTLEIGKAYQVARASMDYLKGDKESQLVALKTLKNIDIFIKYPEVLEMIEREIVNE